MEVLAYLALIFIGLMFFFTPGLPQYAEIPALAFACFFALALVVKLVRAAMHGVKP